MKSEITMDSRIKAREDILVSNMDGETVMMSIELGKYYNLGTVGGAIWEFLKESIKVGELVDKLLEEYDIDRETCVSHTMEFINELKKNNLIIIQ